MDAENTVVRSLHDVGVAAWFGGSLMGAVGLNGASGDIADATDRARVASAGWARWSPVAAAAIGAHLLGGLGLVLANRGRVVNHRGVRVNTVVKTSLTAAAIGTTVYSGVLGAKLAQADRVPADSATVPSKATPDDLATVQQQQRILQWITPILTGLIIVLGAQQGEQQRPRRQAAGTADALRRHLRRAGR